MSIIKRIVAGFALMLILMALIAVNSYLNTNKLNGAIDKVVNQSTPGLIATFPLQSLIQQSYQNLSVYTSERDAEKRAQLLQQQGETEKEFVAAFNLLKEKQHNAANEQALVQLFEQSQQYFSAVLSSMENYEELQLVAERLAVTRKQFIKLEDTYSWSKSELLEQSAENRATANKAEFIINSVEQNLKNLRRADSQSDLARIKSMLSRDIQVAVKRTQGLKISSRTKEQFVGVLEKLQLLALSEQGLLSDLQQQGMRQQQMGELTILASQLAVSSQQQIQSLVNQAEQDVTSVSENATDIAYQAIIQTILVAIASGVVAVIIGYTVIRSIRKPLEKTVPVLVQMSKGDMSVRTGYRSSTEFGVIAEAIDAVAEQTSQTLTQIQQGSALVAQEASTSAEGSERNLDLVRQQKMQTEMISAAASEMEMSAAEMSSYTQHTLSEVEQTNNTVHHGQQEVAKSSEITRDLLKTINNAAEQCDQLVESSQSIGTVMEVIRNIAEQTNLLALNAAIEAARAGEQGRGFAVVADEVRSLATRSHQSTEQIETMVETLQATSDKIARDMNLCLEQTNSCASQTELAKTAFDNITARVETIFDMTSKVADATQEQISASTDISRHIAGISEGAVQLDNEARQAAESSDVLSELAEKQQTLIKRFQI
ncbi:HAMP domain-containing methyl-accepting chemotaxis protein [Vibrio sp. SCSIO 43137]|uniref:HAMP domain-containing methyl-accepting chemotaxis protein n=1 Tax=Vibrio sp. SCSIO 43137 TaxID=3021011 RepID=UPI0023079B98|nr:methyl-accepting chemotaxis protein [Vibrio sp. SCSIO 43137]WCE31912.1 methyl-accepting chemotaxis protein [Vibrio sp. SCSIO 43137]